LFFYWIKWDVIWLIDQIMKKQICAWCKTNLHANIRQSPFYTWFYFFSGIFKYYYHFFNRKKVWGLIHGGKLHSFFFKNVWITILSPLRLKYTLLSSLIQNILENILLHSLERSLNYIFILSYVKIYILVPQFFF